MKHCVNDRSVEKRAAETTLLGLDVGGEKPRRIETRCGTFH